MRKWTYLVATLLMAGTTATFTGCIDTDEPEGIAELRGAKSELIKAQAAVKLVEVEMNKALVAEQELINAGLALKNKSAEIDLQLHELDVKLKQLWVERAEAATEVAKAQAEAAIAKAEADKTEWEKKKELVIEQYKAKMLIAETATAQAQEAFKQALEQIEASKILLTDEEQIRLNVVEAKVAYAKIDMDKAMYGYPTISVTTGERVVSTVTDKDGNISDKKITYYTISQNTDFPKDGPYKEGSIKYLQDQLADYPNWIADGNIEAKLDLAVKQAESALNTAQKTADGLKAILDNEYTTLADWEAQVKKLKDEMATLDVQKRQFDLNREELLVANPNLETNKDKTAEALDNAKDALKKVKETAKVASAYSKDADKSISAGLDKAFDQTTDGVEGYTKGGKFAYAKDILIVNAQKQIDGWAALVDKATKGINLEDIEWSKGEVAKAKAESEKADKTYNTNYADWVKARDKYLETENIDLDASKKAAENAITAYNALKDDQRKTDANINLLVAALSKYYQDAKDKELKATTAKVTDDITSKTQEISAWILADAANFKSVVGTQLNLITWTAGTITGAAKISDSVKGQLLTLGASSGKTPFEVWKAASKDVFGNEFDLDGKPRRTPVTSDMVLEAVDGDKLNSDLKNNVYGSLGYTIYAKANAAKLQAVIDQAETYKALKAEFTAQKAKEQTALETETTKLTEKVAKAETAKADAQAAYDKVFKEVDENIEKVGKEYDYKDKIVDKINTAITDYIGSLEELKPDYSDKESLEEIKEAVNTAYLEAIEDLLDAKSALADAKRNVEKFAEGTYTDEQYIKDTFANIQEKIEVQQAIYDAAKVKYDEASAQLKALLAIFLK